MSNKHNSRFDANKDLTLDFNFINDLSVKEYTEDDDFIYIGGHVSTIDKDSYGDIIPTSSWTEMALARFKNNPIILLNHDKNMPIGKALSNEIKVTEKGLYMVIAIDKTVHVAGQIKKGILKTFSIGFILKDYNYNQPLDAWILTNIELYEVSVVTIPANETAVFDYLKSLNNNEKMKEKDEKTALDKFLDFFAPKQVVKSQDEILTGVATEVQEKLKNATDEISTLKSANDALNSEVTKLREDFANLKPELDSKATELESFATKNATLETEIETLKSEKSQLENQVKALNSNVKLLQLGGKSLPKNDDIVADPAILSDATKTEKGVLAKNADIIIETLKKSKFRK